MKMKIAHKSIVLGALITVGAATSCDTDTLHELNINPQAVNQMDLHFLFTSAELGIASNGSSGDNRYIDWRTNIGMMSTAIQHLATTGDISAAGMYYRHNEEICAAPFDMTYQDQLKNIAEIIRQTDEGGYAAGQLPNTRNAAIVLKVWSFQRLTDFYGAIPYTEANKGLEGIFFPAYDNQSTIYPALLQELETAAGALSASADDAGFAAADILYDGDIAKWKKFAYSLMLRMAMRVSNVNQSLAEEYISKAVAGGVFESNDDNLFVPMATEPSLWTNQNGISRAFIPGDGGNKNFLSKTLVDFLKGSDPDDVSDDDPRLMVLTDGIGIWDASGWNPTKQDPLEQIGMPSGLFFDAQAQLLGVTDFLTDTTYSRINPYMLDRDDPYMIMTYAEVELLLAEAAERGLAGVADAEGHYNEGVKAAMQMYGPYFANNEASGDVSDGDVAAYLANYPYGGGGVRGDESPLEQIGYQMWASKFFNWWEAWSDWRRTGYPTLVEYTDDVNNVTGGKIPVRLRYPTAETVANPNFNQDARNNYTTPVWWDGGSE